MKKMYINWQLDHSVHQAIWNWTLHWKGEKKEDKRMQHFNTG